jgi:hypothetical protein
MAGAVSTGGGVNDFTSGNDTIFSRIAGRVPGREGRMRMKSIFGMASVGALLLLTGAASAQHVNLELSLLVDVSGSVSTTEFNIQRQGYANAFSNPNFFASNIGAGNSIAVNFIEWSGNGQQSQVVGWTIINDQASANAFAAAIMAGARAFSGQTAVGQAITFGANSILNNSITSDKQIIDVSGDGSDNVNNPGNPAFTINARNAALAAGIDQINGLAITGSETGLLAWYNNHVKGGDGAFVIEANNFAAFSAAVEEKISLEISQAIPLPGVAGMAGLGLAGIAIKRRRKA